MELNIDEAISVFIPFIVANKMLLDCKKHILQAASGYGHGTMLQM
jgi:hypothetical protein